jgi:STE24 endopeptidase
MKGLLVAVAVALFAALVWGSIVNSQPVPSRGALHATEVGPDWYAALAADPETATNSYLQRVAPEVRARGDALGQTRYVILAMRVLVLVLSVTLIMFSGAAARLRERLARRGRHLWLQDASFALILFAALFVLTLPVETYADFVRIRHAGFTHRTYVDWLGDAALGWAVNSVFAIVGVTLVMALIRRRPRSWVAWATVVYLVLSSFYVLIEPQYIEPLFNRFTPLADGPAKQAILSLAKANGVPASDVLVRDASRQSELLNAHVSGIGGTAQIVLDDNTVAQTPKAEFEFVMAHEIGHYVLAHIPKDIVFDTLVMGLGFLFIGWGSQRLISRYGRRWRVDGIGDTGAMPVLWGLLLLWGFVSLPINNGISREQENEADIFGVNASQQPLGLAEFMIRDADAEKLDPSSLEEWLLFDHPSARNRIYAAMRWRAEHLARTKP